MRVDPRCARNDAFGLLREHYMRIRVKRKTLFRMPQLGGEIRDGNALAQLERGVAVPKGHAVKMGNMGNMSPRNRAR